MRFAALSVSLAIGLTCLVGAQQPPVKTTTTGVVLDVTVVDGKGKAVLDLTPDEFELSEDGARQRIVSVTLVHGALVRPLNANGAGGRQPAGHPAPPQPPTPAARPPAASPPSATPILFHRPPPAPPPPP